jgi:hypothetical protein
MKQQAIVSAHTLQPFAVAAYLVAILLILAPPLEVLTNMPAVQASEARWRLGAVGLLTGSLLLPVAGFLLAIVTAYLRGHRWLFWLAMGSGGVVLLGMIGLLALFALDAVQVWAGVDAATVNRFNAIVIRSVGIQIGQLVALGAVLWGGFLANRRRGWRAVRASGASESGVVVGAKT